MAHAGESDNAGFSMRWVAIERNSERLFVDDSALCKVEVTTLRAADDSHSDAAWSKKCFASTLDQLNTILKVTACTSSARMTLIHRANSWSRMKITFAMFNLLCRECKIDHSFMNLLMGMGKKIHPKDEHFINCNSQLSGLQSGDRAKETDGPCLDRFSFVICYNIRYFEQHGRDLKDPWSCRQSAVHQKYYSDQTLSDWTVVQPPSWFDKLLRDSNKEFRFHPLGFHAQYIMFAVQNWREYLDSLSSNLLLLDQKISSRKQLREFDIDFSVAQHVQSIRKRLYHAQTILDGTQAVLRTIADHSEKLRDLAVCSSSAHQGFVCKINNIGGEIRSHKSTTHELLKLSDDIQSMISNILNFKNQELLATNGLHLAQMTETNRKDSKTLVEMATLSSGESRATRIATLIAMFYLPASLVLSFFSTGFVEYGWEHYDTVSIHGKVWIAFTSIAVLVVGTLSVFWTWSRLADKK